MQLERVLQRLIYSLVATAVLLPVASNAHHSRANYAMDEFHEYDGTVVEVAWRNPHAFAVIEIAGESGLPETWLLEMNSMPILASMGWTKYSLKVGDHIHVRGNPDKRPDRRQLFVRYVLTASGDRLWSFGRPAAERRRQNKDRVTIPADVTQSTDFTGIWLRARLADTHTSKRKPFGVSDLPATPAGKAVLAKYDPNDDPAFQCEPKSLPATIVPVYPLRITRVSDELMTFEYEFNNGHRDIHFGPTDFSGDIEPSLMGYSIGSFEDDELVIKSRRFLYNRWGNGRGLPSSEQKEVTERYRLVEDGERMEVQYSVTDPVYLEGLPLERFGAFILRNNAPFSDFDCDRSNAVRHLTGH